MTWPLHSSEEVGRAGRDRRANVEFRDEVVSTREHANAPSKQLAAGMAAVSTSACS